MEKKHILLLAIGAVCCVILFFINVYLGATGAIILAALAMSVLIMEDSRVLPEITIELGDDAKKIRVKNEGNAAGLRDSMSPLSRSISSSICPNSRPIPHTTTRFPI